MRPHLLQRLLALLVCTWTLQTAQSAPQSAPQQKTKEKPAKKEKTELAVGKPAPEIEGEDIDGQKFKLSDYRGKIVVLDFWGNW
jgi:cytochrome oxidase Cu insertion factor (SCO1/SenC/PrrC family)